MPPTWRRGFMFISTNVIALIGYARHCTVPVLYKHEQDEEQMPIFVCVIRFMYTIAYSTRSITVLLSQQLEYYWWKACLRSGKECVYFSPMLSRNPAALSRDSRHIMNMVLLLSITAGPDFVTRHIACIVYTHFVSANAQLTGAAFTQKKRMIRLGTRDNGK